MLRIYEGDRNTVLTTSTLKLHAQMLHTHCTNRTQTEHRDDAPKSLVLALLQGDSGAL